MRTRVAEEKGSAARYHRRRCRRRRGGLSRRTTRGRGSVRRRIREARRRDRLSLQRRARSWLPPAGVGTDGVKRPPKDHGAELVRAAGGGSLTRPPTLEDNPLALYLSTLRSAASRRTMLSALG